jgi:MFS transporter, DHA1 family, multidrug resistance protein
VLIGHYGLSPTLYSIFFSINAVSFFTVAQFTGKLADRFGLRRVVRIAVIGYFSAIAVLFALTASGLDRLDVLAACLFVGYGFLGLVIPTTAVLAMEDHGGIAGTASAIMGTLHFVTGALAVAAVGLFVDGTALPMVTGIAACALVTFSLAQVTLRQRNAVEVPAE